MWHKLWPMNDICVKRERKSKKWRKNTTQITSYEQEKKSKEKRTQKKATTKKIRYYIFIVLLTFNRAHATRNVIFAVETSNNEREDWRERKTNI